MPQQASPETDTVTINGQNLLRVRKPNGYIQICNISPRLVLSVAKGYISEDSLVSISHRNCILILSIKEVSMTVSKQVTTYIMRQRYGRVFTLDDFMKSSKLESNRAAITALSRCVEMKLVIRISPGVYYKPQKSRFGTLPVDTQELINALSRKKHAEYVVAGAAAMNALGLSTQLPMVRSYIISERVRADLKSVNIKIEYSKALSYFTNSLKINDSTQKKHALVFWSALQYISKDKFTDYRNEYISRFNKMLDENARTKFLRALPPSMSWARSELGN